MFSSLDDKARVIDQSNAFIVPLLMQNGYHSGMNFRHLRAFATIADAGGFARAAARLNLSQPALSRQIHALEAELGVPLFDRIGRRVQLTSEGEDLLRRSRRLLTEVESLGERARALRTGQTGVLRVGTTPQAIESLLVDFLGRYQARHPGVEVHLVEDGGARLPGRLERGEVQVSIMAAGDDHIHGRPLCPLYLLAVMPETHGMARRGTLDITELTDDPLLLLGRGYASREWFYAACQVAQMRPRVLLESTAPQTLIALAGAGYGIAVVPSMVRIPRGKLRAVPLLHRRVPIGRWMVIAWNPQRFLAPYAEQFVEEMVAHSRHNYPGRELIRRAPPLPRPKTRVG
jgi:LysR family transcriptional regulator, cyn operon transcriptional activator